MNQFRGKTRLAFINTIKEFLKTRNLTCPEFCVGIDFPPHRLYSFLDGTCDIYLDEYDLIRYGMLNRSKKKYLVKDKELLERNLKIYKQWNRRIPKK